MKTQFLGISASTRFQEFDSAVEPGWLFSGDAIHDLIQLAPGLYQRQL
ncbi:hypothetical protein [Bradyrhizobium sp. LMTR 3]|nr:hypothetical protein [Bradyrhizobium sp. LMTR 3]